MIHIITYLVKQRQGARVWLTIVMKCCLLNPVKIRYDTIKRCSLWLFQMILMNRDLWPLEGKGKLTNLTGNFKSYSSFNSDLWGAEWPYAEVKVATLETWAAPEFLDIWPLSGNEGETSAQLWGWVLLQESVYLRWLQVSPCSLQIGVSVQMAPNHFRGVHQKFDAATNCCSAKSQTIIIIRTSKQNLLSRMYLCVFQNMRCA